MHPGCDFLSCENHVSESYVNYLELEWCVLGVWETKSVFMFSFHCYLLSCYVVKTVFISAANLFLYLLLLFIHDCNFFTEVSPMPRTTTQSSVRVIRLAVACSLDFMFVLTLNYKPLICSGSGCSEKSEVKSRCFARYVVRLKTTWFWILINYNTDTAYSR